MDQEGAGMTKSIWQKKQGAHELPGRFDKMTLYNRDFYWVKEHSEFRHGWADFAQGIAEYAIEVQGINEDFSVISWTNPSILVELNYGKGFFLIDQVKWEESGFNEDKGKR